MSRIDGGQVPSVMNLDPYGEHAGAIGEELFAILGRIAARDPRRCRCAIGLRPRPARLLARGAGRVAGGDRARRASPAADRPRRDPQAAPQSTEAAGKISVVHGDYRSGNSPA
jgi:aminoglycoside phosphotransferase (APT) family kinase protein